MGYVNKTLETEEKKECLECCEYFPISLLMEGTRFGETVPICRGCTDWPRPWLVGHKVTYNFTDAVISIEDKKEKEKEEMENNGVTELDKLCHAYQEAQEDEKRAKARRLEIEGLIVAISDVQYEGASVTKTRYYKCTCTGKLNRKLDVETWENIRDQIPEDLRPVKTTLDLPKLRAIEKENPDVFKVVANAISSKPAKVSVKVEILNNEDN